MPQYHFICESCEREFSEFLKISELDDYKENTRCKACNGTIRTVIKSLPKLQTFKAGWYENFTDKPIWIGSKRDLKDACERYNTGSVYLDDGIPG